MAKKQTNGNLALEQQRVIVIPAHDEIVARKLRVAAYARVSSSSEDQLNSYRVQNQYYSELISSNPDWEMVDIYADEGITGTSVEKREDFQRMMQDCRKGRVDCILVAPIPELTDTKNSRNMERKEAIKMETKKKKGTPPPRYDEAFKAGAVRMVTEQGRQPTEVAKDLGICIDTLRSWMKSSGIQMGQASRQNREQQRIRELEAEIRALRKQLGEKEEVIDILKKSVGILSKP